MEAYANALLIAIPAFMVLMLTELIYGYAKGKQTYVFMDTISSLSSGLTNILKDTLGLVVILISYPWLSQQLAITHIEADLWLYLSAFVCIDFASYWSHRLNHKINFFWNQHIIHHSSEEFNMACALRQSISNILGYGALFMVPAAFWEYRKMLLPFWRPFISLVNFGITPNTLGNSGGWSILLSPPPNTVFIMPSIQFTSTKISVQYFVFGIGYLAPFRKNSMTSHLSMAFSSPCNHGILCGSISSIFGH